MTSNENPDILREELLKKKEELKAQVREKFAVARDVGKHKPGVRVLTRLIRKINRRLEALTSSTNPATS